MYDLPEQTLMHWQQTLSAIRELPITHLSLYNLTIEPHTLFFKKKTLLAKLLPDEETSLKMYEKAVHALAQQGLQRYEISAFAKPGYESQHNTGYWTARPFLGFGPSAFSYWGGKRFRNVAHLNRYCQALKKGESPIDFEEKLDDIASRRELLVIRLRLCEGVDLTRFQQNHGALDSETHKTLADLILQGLIRKAQDHLFLTPRGILFYDTVASELI
jgi:oxygen-independent coproporphyrinogen-3 oxidase